jgi:catechol 2,3-dioxygenase-like lactoylglutathione lyase family enzyme
MIDHIEIHTERMDECLRFYAKVLAPLGYAQKVNGIAKGFGNETTLDFFLVEGAPSQLHFAFTAPDRATVDRVYAAARAGRLTLDRAPGLAPHIHPHYYAGYLRDPDGRLIEFVCHAPEPAN